MLCVSVTKIVICWWMANSLTSTEHEPNSQLLVDLGLGGDGFCGLLDVTRMNTPTWFQWTNNVAKS